MASNFYRQDDQSVNGTFTLTVKGIDEHDVQILTDWIEKRAWMMWATVDARYRRTAETRWTNDDRKIPDNENW